MATMSVNVYPLELLKIGSFLCKDKTNVLQKKITTAVVTNAKITKD